MPAKFPAHARRVIPDGVVPPGLALGPDVALLPVFIDAPEQHAAFGLDATGSPPTGPPVPPSQLLRQDLDFADAVTGARAALRIAAGHASAVVVPHDAT